MVECNMRYGDTNDYPSRNQNYNNHIQGPPGFNGYPGTYLKYNVIKC